MFDSQECGEWEGGVESAHREKWDALAFFCQGTTEHLVKGMAQLNLPRLVLTARMSVLPHHGDVFDEMVKMVNLGNRHHFKCNHKGMWTHFSGRSKGMLVPIDWEEHVSSVEEGEEAEEGAARELKIVS